jgi:schlafen family protein
MRGVRVLGGKNGLRVDGYGPLHPGHTNEELVGALETIGPASLASLRQALRRRSPRTWLFAQVTIVDVPEAKLASNPDGFFREPVEIRLTEDPSGSSEYTVFAASYGDPEDGLPNTRQVEALLGPFLTRQRATASVHVDNDEYDFGGAYQLGIDITMPVTGRTVRNAFDLGKGVLALLDAVQGGGLTRERTLDLLRSGRVDVLLGQPETDWIDFKRQGYAKTEHGKFGLAKDVAAFANASGGILVLGVATNKSGLVETASAITPCPVTSVSAQSYKAILRRRLHPPPERVEVFSLPQPAGGDVWVVAVPPQPEEFKPMLVHGAVIEGKVTDAYFSIVVRRGDDNVPTNPQAVHALLSAGRAALHLR